MTEGEETFFTHYVEYIDDRLRRFFHKLLVAFIILGLCTAGSYYYITVIADRNRESLCSIRIEAENRVAQSRKFLRENPEGVPGISPAIVAEGILTSKRTINALKELNCDS